MLATVFVCHAQKYGLEKADSLIRVLQTEKTDIGRVRLMADISTTLYCHNNKLGLEYAAKALNLSDKIGYKKGMALAFHAAGVNYIFRGDFLQAIDNLTKAKIILEKEADNAMLARCYMHIAGAHQFVLHSDTAITFANKAFQLFAQIKDSTGLAECCHITGLIYQDTGPYDSAIKWFDKGLAISRKLGQQDMSGLLLSELGGSYIAQNNYIKSLTYSFEAMKLLEKINGGFLAVPIGNIGYMYMQIKDYGKAKAYIQKAADVAEKQNDVYRRASSLSLLGAICNEEKKYADALKNFSLSLELMKQINNAVEICACYGNIGDTYHKMGDYPHAFDYLFVALQMSKELNIKWLGNAYLYIIGNVYLQLFKNKTGELPQHPKIPHNKQVLLQRADDYFTKAKLMALEVGDIEDLGLILKGISELKLLQGNPTAALNAYKESVVYNDSLNSISKRNDFTRKEMEYEYGKQQDSIKLVTDKKTELSKAELKLQQKATEVERQNKRFAGIAAITLLLVSAYIYYLFLQRHKLSSQLASSLITLKDTQAQLINIEREKEGEKIRNKIAGELHDDIGSTLSGIAMYSHMIDRQMKSGNYDIAKTSVSVIQKSAIEIVGKLSDLVWSVNPSQDSLQQLFERLHQYGMDMCKTKNIQFIIHIPASGLTFNLPAEQRYNIFLVAKESINNAVKYSNASLIGLNVKETAGMLEISVSDNGNGFIIDEIKKGNGLENMKKRMEEIGALYSHYSKPGEGSIVSIQLKIT